MVFELKLFQYPETNLIPLVVLFKPARQLIIVRTQDGRKQRSSIWVGIKGQQSFNGRCWQVSAAGVRDAKTQIAPDLPETILRAAAQVDQHRIP